MGRHLGGDLPDHGRSHGFPHGLSDSTRSAWVFSRRIDARIWTPTHGHLLSYGCAVRRSSEARSNLDKEKNECR